MFFFQGPMMNTSIDFWQMIWDENTSVIIMLNRIIENNRLKCHPYWPTGEEDEDGDRDDLFESSMYNVYLTHKENFDFYAISELTLVKLSTNEERKVYHLHYYDWPDFGVPESPTKFLKFLKLVRNYYKDCKGVPVVHCSAGIGRTGTLVLVDTILTIIKEKKTQNIDIYSILVSIRQHRFGLVQTADQLRFCFLAILTGMQDIDTSDFTNQRIAAEIDFEMSSEEDEEDIEYSISDDSDSDEENDYNRIPARDRILPLEDDEEDDDNEILIDQADLDALNKGSDKESDREDEVVSPSSIEFIPEVSELITPENSTEPASESASPFSDLQPDLDTSPELPEVPLSGEANEKQEEIRKRKEQMKERVDDMKNKLKKHEESTIRKQYIWDNFGKPLLFGSAAAIGLSILVYLVR